MCEPYWFGDKNWSLEMYLVLYTPGEQFNDIRQSGHSTSSIPTCLYEIIITIILYLSLLKN